MSPTIIVGAGPAGMMLAYLLASNGRAVRVLERHADFEREFRGEFVQPTAIRVFEQLGIVEELRRRGGVQVIGAVQMYVGDHLYARSTGANGQAGLAIHQPTFLTLMHEACSRYPHYRLDMGARVDSLVKNDGRVTGVRARIQGREEQLDASLVVVASGRNTALRKDVGLEVDVFEPAYSLLWLRFDVSDRPELYPTNLDGFAMPRAFSVLYPTHGKRVQLMWRRKQSAALDWKAPIATLREALLDDVPPHWRPIVESLDDATERQVLRVVCDRVRRWWAPGVLFIGDAAHTMSPIGGQGVSMAVRDAIVTANHVLSKNGADAVDEATLAAIEAERVPELEKAQALQTRFGKISDAPAPVQWMLAHLMIPLMTKITGGSYLRGLQFGFTDVVIKRAVPVPS